MLARAAAGLLTAAMLATLLSASPVATAHARSSSARDLLPPHGLIPNGFVLDESQTQEYGDAFAQRVYVGDGGTSWAVAASVLPTSESAWLNYLDRQRALGQLNVTIEPISGLGEEAVTITDRPPAPLVVARTFVKTGRAVLSVVETARAGALSPARRMHLLRWMEHHGRKLRA